ncbi:MAG: hypothetical protein WBF99_08805 [Xanthobacteraceae bacterium]
MKQKIENRRNMANDQIEKRQAKLQSSALNSHDFNDFIDEMLSEDRSIDDNSNDRPICHVY